MHSILNTLYLAQKILKLVYGEQFKYFKLLFFETNIYTLSLFSRLDTNGCCFNLKLCNLNVQENWTKKVTDHPSPVCNYCRGKAIN